MIIVTIPTDFSIQEQREQVKASSQRLKRVFAFIERTVLREKAKKKEQQLVHVPAGSVEGSRTPSNLFQTRREKQLAKKMKGVTIDTDTTTELV